MPETWVGWAAWAYLFIGLGFAAQMWHEMVNEKEFEQFVERHGHEIPQQYRRRTWYASTSVLAAMIVAGWPLVAAHEVYLTFKYRIPTWRLRVKNRRIRRRADRLVRDIDEMSRSRRG